MNPGQMDEYLSRVKKLQGVMDKLGASASVEAWQVTAGGAATGTTFVGLEYPSLVRMPRAPSRPRETPLSRS